MTALIEKLGAFLIAMYAAGKKRANYYIDAVTQLFVRPFRYRIVMEQIVFIGQKSLLVVTISAFFVGAVFSLQIGVLFKIFQAENIMGLVTAKALARELAPLLTAFLVAGRAGSAVTAEIATMKVTEQIDAIESFGVSPLHYLVGPRLLAFTVSMPLLSLYNFIVGMFGCYVISSFLFDVDFGSFFTRIRSLMDVWDLLFGLQKAVFFWIRNGSYLD